MNDAIDDKVALPIRLLPGRQATGAALLFVLIWLGVLTFIASDMVPRALANLPHFSDKPTSILFLLVPAFMFYVGISMLITLVSRFLPGSPLDHLVIDKAGLKRRKLWKTQQINWTQIRQFGCVERTRRTKRRSSIYWLVMAEGADAIGRDEDEREELALLSFDVDDYSPLFANEAECAEQLTQWLNDLLADVRNGEQHESVPVPASLRNSIWTGADGATRYRLGQRKEPNFKESRRKGVIER